MAVARDLVGISVPFAAGVAAGAFLCPLVPSIQSVYIVASVLACLTGICFFCTLHLENRHKESRIRFVIALTFLLAGLFCAVQIPLTQGLPDAENGLIGRAAGDALERMKGCIDSIPYVSPTTGPLVKALLTGDRSGLDNGTTEAFRVSGASHILALSGLHLGVIYLILCKLTAPLGNSGRARAIKCLCIIGASGFYTLMTGAGPSIVRAFIFIALAECLKLSGRKREASRILLASLTIQLTLKPEVINSLGFQLSYLAMAGIIFVYPALKEFYPESRDRRWDRIDPMRRIWNGAAMSISCQLFTAPLAWFRFGTFPEYFLITNLIALPATSAIMVLSVATIALSALGICPGMLVVLNDQAVQVLIWSLQIISGLSEPLQT